MNRIQNIRFAALIVFGSAVLGASAADSLPLQSVRKAGEVIDAALQAHGGAERIAALNSLVSRSDFVTHALQQSRKPEPPWDTNRTEVLNAVDFTRKAFYVRNTGTGGGFEFDGGNLFDGDTAWQIDYRGRTAAPVAEPDLPTALGPFVRVTPALIMKQLQERRQTSHWLGETNYRGRPHDVITLVMTVGPALSLYFDRESRLLSGMERALPPFGQVEYRFDDYETIDGIAFNRKFRLLVDGGDNLEAENLEYRLNVPIEPHLEVGAELQRIPAITADELNLQEIEEGIFLVGSNGGYGLIVEMADHLVAIEGTEGAAQRIEEVRKHVAGKPVRYGVLSHHHNDHTPGAAVYAREGATIVAPRAHETVVRAAAGATGAKFEWVAGRLKLEDATRSVELIDIGPTAHSEHVLVAWLPAERILFQADHFQQPASGPIPPAVTATADLAAALDRLGIEPDRIVSAHSPRISGPADLRHALDSRSSLMADAR